MPQETHYVSAAKIVRLVMFRDQNCRLLSVPFKTHKFTLWAKAGGTYRHRLYRVHDGDFDIYLSR
jgi:hypothetical protein